jgi:hypothetical protein
MTVNLTLSETNGGSSFSDTEDLGSVSPGSTVDFQDVFISHDAENNKITDVALYLTQYAGSNYLGSDAPSDLTEILGWGDAATGGFKVVMDGWGSWTTGTRNDVGTWLTFKNGYGDVDSQIPLAKESIVTGVVPSVDGEIPVDGTAHVQVEIDTPSSVPAGAGYRAFSLVIAYSATS